MFFFGRLFKKECVNFYNLVIIVIFCCVDLKVFMWEILKMVF